MRWKLLAAAIMALTACAREPRVQSSSLDVVTIRYFGDHGGAVDGTASENADATDAGRSSAATSPNRAATSWRSTTVAC